MYTDKGRNSGLKVLVKVEQKAYHDIMAFLIMMQFEGREENRFYRLG